MADFDDNLPLQRSFVEQRIGQLVGIFQIDSHSLRETSEAMALPSEDDVVGLVAVADGGKLSETGFNCWTIASQLFKEAGCPDSQRVDFTLSEFARRLWGANGRSAERRRRIVDACQELMRTRVVVVGIDPYTHKPAKDAHWELNLLEAAGATTKMKPILAAARNGDRKALAELAALSSADDNATFSIVLPKWLADSVRDDRGVILDYDVQRALRGSAKRIWVQLESHTSWQHHRLPTGDEQQLDDHLDAILAGSLAPYVMPADDEPVVELYTTVIALNAEVYQSFGLTHANRKRDLEQACASILANDATYLRAEIVAQRGHRRRFELRLARAAGATRQERHRLALKHRAAKNGQPEESVAA